MKTSTDEQPKVLETYTLIKPDGTRELVEVTKRRRRRKKKRKRRKKDPISHDMRVVLEMRANKKKQPRVHLVHVMECRSKDGFYRCIACRHWLDVTSDRLQDAKSVWSEGERFVVIYDYGRNKNGQKGLFDNSADRD